MMTTLLIILFTIFILVIISTQKKQPATKELLKPIVPNSYKSINFMSDNEIDFFNRLIEAFPECYVFPQVAMSGLVSPKTTDYKQQNAIKNTYNRLRVDFVLYKDKKVIAVIELDDKTHKNKEDKDQKRDDILAQAGYKTYRFMSNNKPTVEELRVKVSLI